MAKVISVGRLVRDYENDPPTWETKQELINVAHIIRVYECEDLEVIVGEDNEQRETSYIVIDEGVDGEWIHVDHDLETLHRWMS